MSMTVDEMLKAVGDCTCDEPATECECWNGPGQGVLGEQWASLGESADGEPDWTITESDYGGFVVERECGWYYQRGDAGDPEGVVRLARAMDAAQDALDAALREGEG